LNSLPDDSVDVDGADQPDAQTAESHGPDQSDEEEGVHASEPASDQEGEEHDHVSDAEEHSTADPSEQQPHQDLAEDDEEELHEHEDVPSDHDAVSDEDVAPQENDEALSEADENHSQADLNESDDADANIDGDQEEKGLEEVAQVVEDQEQGSDEDGEPAAESEGEDMDSALPESEDIITNAPTTEELKNKTKSASGALTNGAKKPASKGLSYAQAVSSGKSFLWLSIAPTETDQQHKDPQDGPNMHANQNEGEN